MKEEIKADGKSYTDINLETLEEQVEASKVWSEGRKSLEELLLYCMQNGIKTMACCAGHDDSSNQELNGYIGFNIKDERTKNVVLKLLSLEFKNKESLVAAMHRFKDEHLEDDKRHVSFYCIDNKQDVLFERLLQEIKEVLKEKEKSQEIDYRVEKMLEILETECSENIDFEMVYNAQKDKFNSNLAIQKIAQRGCEEKTFEEALSILSFIQADMSGKQVTVINGIPKISEPLPTISIGKIIKNCTDIKDSEIVAVDAKTKQLESENKDVKCNNKGEEFND